MIVSNVFIGRDDKQKRGRTEGIKGGDDQDHDDDDCHQHHDHHGHYDHDYDDAVLTTVSYFVKA